MLNGVYRFPAMESVIFGKPYAEALGQEVDRVEARAVFILASGTLARETDTVERLRYTYIDPYGVALGYEDVFTKLEQANRHYESAGLGNDYVRRLLR